MPRPAVISAVVGAALLVGAPTVWFLQQPPDTVGDLAAVTTPPPPQDDPEPPPPEPEATPSRRLEPVAPQPEPEEPVEDVEEPVAAPLPRSIRIDAIGVDAPVVPVGLEPDGAMEIPEDVSTIGWYELGVTPGDQGTAVLAGHVDSRTQGRGAFFDLRQLDVDDLVTVEGEGGAETAWRVVARTSYPKDELPLEEIFTRFSDTRLVLITCGGGFDSDTRHYTENIVVYTEPVA